MQKRFAYDCRSALVLACLLQLTGTAMAETATATLAREDLNEYCVECHNFDDYAGGIDFTAIIDDDLPQHAETWEKAIRKLRAGLMPPPGQERPAWNDYVAFTEALENEIDSAATINPGSKTIHRLNRNEYANVIRDLLDMEIDPEVFLPADTSANGFDNISGSLTISPTLLEAYAAAAGRISRMAVGYWNTPGEVAYISPADTSQNMHNEEMPLGTRGGIAVEHNFPSDGEYKFTIQNFGVGNFIPGAELELSIDGERAHLWEYKGVGMSSGMGGDNDGTLEATVAVTAGAHLVGAAFLATNFRPGIDMIKQYDRKSIENEPIDQLQYHPAIGFMRVLGPFNATRTQDSPSIRKIFTCRPANADERPACARRILSTLAKKAYRRPVNDSDLEQLMTFYQQGVQQSGVFEDGIELALRRLLADPEFLVRMEAEPADLSPGEAYRISDLELASRLSFFLWSSIPDDELLDLASEGRLSDPEVLEGQVSRMLADAKANALVTNFAEQWLYLRNLPTTSPDGIYFPDWDNELRESFKTETEMLFESIIREDRSVVTLIDADYTFVNERLAKHYGIPNIYGSQFRRIELGPELDYRRGILGKGSFLSTTFSENFRTSPVKRGVWVLENILGSPPPAPPANVPALEDTGQADAIRNLRDQLTLHRQNEPCATCHKIMDPIGFSLENFNADGKWRTYEGHPRQWGGKQTLIESEVQLWDGTPSTGVTGLRNALLKYTPQFVRFATERLMTYGLGRGVEYYDMPVIRSIVKNAEADNYRFSSLVQGIVSSPPFQMRVKLDDTVVEQD